MNTPDDKIYDTIKFIACDNQAKELGLELISTVNLDIEISRENIIIFTAQSIHDLIVYLSGYKSCYSFMKFKESILK